MKRSKEEHSRKLYARSNLLQRKARLKKDRNDDDGRRLSVKMSEELVEKAGEFEKLIAERRSELESIREKNKAFIKSLLTTPIEKRNGSVAPSQEVILKAAASPVSSQPAQTDALELERRYLVAFMRQGQRFNQDLHKLRSENKETMLALQRRLRLNTFLLALLVFCCLAFFAASSCLIKISETSSFLDDAGRMIRRVLNRGETVTAES